MHPILEDAGEGLWPFALIIIVLDIAWILNYLPEMLTRYMLSFNILYWFAYGLAIVLAWKNGRDIED